MPAKLPKSKTAAAQADAVPTPAADAAGETVTVAKPAAKPRARATKAAADAGAPAKTPARRASARAAAATADTVPTVVALDADLLEQIRTEAYLIWLNEGQPHGRDHDHWAQAEAAVRGRFVPMQQAAE